MMSGFLRSVAAVGLFVVSAGAVEAQDSRPISFGVMGGLSVPVGDNADAVKSGYNVTGSVYLRPGSALSFRGDVGYDVNKLDTDIVDLDQKILSFTANAKYRLGGSGNAGSIAPYVIGGGGVYRASIDGESDTEPGVAVGGGVEFLLSGFTTFAEARFVNVFADGGSGSWIPITFGIRF